MTNYFHSELVTVKMSKVIQDCIGLENSRHFSTDLQNKNQSRFGGPRFSRALGMRSLIGFLL